MRHAVPRLLSGELVEEIKVLGLGVLVFQIKVGGARITDMCAGSLQVGSVVTV